MKRIILVLAFFTLTLPAHGFDGTYSPDNVAIFEAAPLDLPPDLMAQASPGATAGVDPLIGTWKLNLEKSTANYPLPKVSPSFTVVKDGDHMVSTVEGVDDQGRASKFVLPHIYDGVPHPVAANPNFDSVAFTRIGNTLNQVRFRQGKAVEISQVIIVPGKTFTSTAEGIATSGFSYHYVYVWDRQ